MADTEQDRHAEYVSVKATDLKLILQAADDVTQWSQAEWAARCRVMTALHNDGSTDG